MQGCFTGMLAEEPNPVIYLSAQAHIHFVNSILMHLQNIHIIGSNGTWKFNC